MEHNKVRNIRLVTGNRLEYITGNVLNIVTGFNHDIVSGNKNRGHPDGTRERICE